MSLFGKSLGDYSTFARTGMILIVLVGLVRFFVGISGVPYDRATHLVSMTILILLLSLIYGQRAAAVGFGGYRHLLPTAFMLSATMYGFIILAILVEGLGGIHGYFHTYTLASIGERLPLGLGPAEMNLATHIGGQLLAMLIFTLPLTWGLASLGFLLSHHLGFLRNALLLLLAMAALRVLVGAAGVPYAIGTWITSVTLLAIILSVYYGYRAPSRGFISYGHVVVVGILIAVALTVLVIYGIAVTTSLGIPNYFHAPGEGFQPVGMSIARHVIGHLRASIVVIVVMSVLAGIGFALGKRGTAAAAGQAA